MTFVQRFVRYGWYPTVMVGAVSVAAVSIAGGASPGLVVAVVNLALIPLSLAMEWVAPESDRWRLERGEVAADVLHMLVSNPVPTALFQAVFYGAIVAASQRATGFLGIDLWPDQWPLLAQGALALVIAEFVNYWIHRGLHRSRLWPLHAVHHCSPRMYTLISVRKHPIQTIVTYGGRLSVLWALGVTPEALGLYTVFVSANSTLQHANLAMTTGPFGWVLATPELHRLHHSRHPDELDVNFGDSLIVWDRLFGTCRVPAAGRPGHDEIGLPGIEVRQTWWSHWRLPFDWARLHGRAGG